MLGMEAHQPSTDELVNATERTLSGRTFAIDGVPAEVTEVGTTVDGETDIRTTAGMFTRSEWHTKIIDGDITEV